MIKEIFNGERVRELGRSVLKSPDAIKQTLSVCMFADIAPQITTTASLLPLEPWQVVLAKIGAIAFLTGTYAISVAATLHANAGREEHERKIGHGGLVLTGLGTAAFDVLIVSFPL